MSRRPFRPYDEYPAYPGETRHPVPDLTDAAQHFGLDPRDGDTEVNHDTLNHPWGKVVHLSLTPGPGISLRSAGLVNTEPHPRPFPWAIQARFSTDGVTFTPTIPASWTGQIRFDFIKSFDVKTGVAKESFTLDPGDGLPICALIARALTVSANLLGEGALDLWIQFVVCPTTMIECGELSPDAPVTPPAGTVETLTARYAAVEATTYNIAANPNRGLLVIVNQSAADLFVHLGVGVETGPSGDEYATVVLPANAVAGYEAVNYRGEIYFRFSADDAPGYALVTEGLYP